MSFVCPSCQKSKPIENKVIVKHRITRCTGCLSEREKAMRVVKQRLIEEKKRGLF